MDGLVWIFLIQFPSTYKKVKDQSVPVHVSVA